MQVPLVVMGVSGAGKTTIGNAISLRLGRPFIDADDLHPLANRRKMEAGVPLEDADREPWLRAIADAVAETAARGTAPVLACSALKFSYRELLRAGRPDIAFVYLDGDAETIRARLRARSHAYMPAALLPSQLQTLEPPLAGERAVRLDIAGSVDEIASQAVAWLTAIELAHKEEAR